MQHVSLEDLPEQALLEVHAVDPMIYLVFAALGDKLLPVTGKRGKRLSFPSRFAALHALREAGIASVTFVHRSAYGEMVGLADQGETNELRQVIAL
ncbi:MAG: DUF6482 family protein [Pseudomonadaceae bacterium]|nr:DUF6482 family protein [Pseudomonadaceae bacterium]